MRYPIYYFSGGAKTGPGTAQEAPNGSWSPQVPPKVIPEPPLARTLAARLRNSAEPSAPRPQPNSRHCSKLSSVELLVVDLLDLSTVAVYYYSLWDTSFCGSSVQVSRRTF